MREKMTDEKLAEFIEYARNAGYNTIIVRIDEPMEHFGMKDYGDVRVFEIEEVHHGAKSD